MTRSFTPGWMTISEPGVITGSQDRAGIPAVMRAGRPRGPAPSVPIVQPPEPGFQRYFSGSGRSSSPSMVVRKSFQSRQVCCSVRPNMQS